MIVVFLMLCVVFVGGVLTLGAVFLAGPLAMLTFGLTGFVYRWILLAQRSATIGMSVTGIEVRDAVGERMTRQIAFLHTAGYYVTMFFTPLLLIGWFLMFTTPYRRAMHDLVLGTVVINRPR